MGSNSTSCLALKGWRPPETRSVLHAWPRCIGLGEKYCAAQDGATKIVRVGNSAVAYAWNASESKWDQIGTVVDGPSGSSGGKVTLHGVEYDKVLRESQSGRR